MTGSEFDHRIRAAMRRKWGWVFGADLNAQVPGAAVPSTVGDMIDTVCMDCSMIHNGLIPIERYEDDPA